MTPAQKFAAAEGRTETFRLPETVAKTPDEPPMKKKRHRTGKRVPNAGGNPLSNSQKAQIGILAKEAYDLQSKLDLVDGKSSEDWRHDEQLAAVGIASLRKCSQAHYKRLRGHFTSLTNRKQSLQTFDDLADPLDDADRQAAAHAIREALAELSQTGRDDKPMGEKGAEAYAASIIRNQSRGTSDSVDDAIKAWPVPKLYTLRNTLRNRANALAGKGETHNRNKSQKHS